MFDETSASHRIKGISPEAYRHPLDRMATAALQQIPHFDRVMRRLLGFGIDRIARARLMAGAIRLGEDQLPTAWRLHQEVFQALDMDEIPELYLQQSPISNAMASGTYLPTIALNSRLVEVLDKAGVKAVLGHEAAHVHCHHVLYGTVLGVLGDFVGGFAGGMMPRVLAGLPVSAITFALLGWSRAAEFSADRGAALATRDPDSVCRALMALTAGTAAPHLNLEAFVEQGLTYEEDGSAMIRRIVDVRSTHPLTIRRVRALMDWVGSGEYEQVLGGDYVKRGEEDGFRYEAERAALRYAEELDHLALEEGGESLSEVGEEIDTWLEKTDGEDFDDSAPSDDP